MTPTFARLFAVLLGTAVALAGAVVFLLLREPKAAPPVIELVGRDADFADVAADVAARGEGAGDELGRLLLRKSEARKLFHIAPPRTEYDPLPYYRLGVDLDMLHPWPEHPDGEWRFVTNSHGTRDDDEFSYKKAHLRVIVTGDSHTVGVCNNDESYVNLVEQRLRQQYPGKRIELMNASCGGYSFYNYVGTLERFLEFEPDIFVVGVYSGNDFEESLAPYYFFRGTTPPEGPTLYRKEIQAASELNLPVLAQGILDAKYFQVNPDQEEVATRIGVECFEYMKRICDRRSIHLVCVLIPGLYTVQYDRIAEVLDPVLAAMKLQRSDLDSAERQTDALLSAVRGMGIETIDLRPTFRESEELLYWESDHHIDLEGQAVVADALYPVIERLARHPAKKN